MEMNGVIAAAMPALLKDQDTKAQVVEYLRNLAASVKPQKEEWQSVWDELSELALEHTGKDCRLWLRARYNQQTRILELKGVVVPQDYRLFNEFELGRYPDLHHNANSMPYRKVMICNNYVEAIRIGQAAMPEAVEIWCQVVEQDNIEYAKYLERHKV